MNTRALVSGQGPEAPSKESRTPEKSKAQRASETEGPTRFRARLNARILQDLQAGQCALDTLAIGLFAERTARGGASLRWRAKLGNATVKIKLGDWPTLSIDTARAKAAELRAQVLAGIDPRTPDRAPVRHVDTVQAAVDRYVVEMRAKGRVQRSIDDVLYCTSKYLDTITTTPLESLRAHDVEALHMRMRVIMAPSWPIEL